VLIVSMGAGLGNQMFEYAFYTHLRDLYPRKEIKVDTRFAFPYAHNGIELFDVFELYAEIATKEEVVNLTSGYGLSGEKVDSKNILKNLIRKIKWKLSMVPSTMRIQYDYTEYYEDFLRVNEKQSIYYLGPFANYHYFSAIQDKIKKMYKFPIIEDDTNLKYASLITSSNSVAVHVRKGDYIEAGVELTPPSFYQKAILEIEKNVENAQYFVFTDDVVYARSLFPDKERFIVVEGNSGKRSFRDMQLMSMCKHNITANSTFSFWGAFLNPNTAKKVIAPNLAYTGTKFPFVCDDWILI